MAIKKGSTGKSYEKDKDKIKVTYSDGSTRTVWKSDASYATTKKAMEADTKSYKKTKTAGTSKVNATNALGEGVTAGRGIVANAQVSQKAAAAKTAKANSTYEKEKKAKQQGYKAKNNSALEQAKQLNSQVRNVQAQQTNEFAKGITARSVKAGTALAGQQIKSGTKAGLNSGVTELGRGGTVEGNNFAATADIIRRAMGNKNSNLYQNQQNTAKNIDTLYGVNQRKLALQSAKEQQAIADRYNMSDFNKGEKLVSDLVSTTGAMAPMVALSAVNPLAGAAYMTNMSRGAGELQALQENPFVSNDTARAYGLGNAGIEMGTEYLTGGLAKVPGAIKLGDLAGKAVEGIGNPLLKSVAKGAGDIAGEAGEEMLSEFLNPYLQRATYDPNAENASAKDITYAGLLGGLGAGVINGSVNLAGKVANAGANRNEMPFTVENMIKNAQNQGESSQNAQNAPQQANTNTATNPINNAQNVAQNQSSEADFQQNPQNFQQQQNAPQNVQNQPENVQVRQENVQNPADNVRTSEQNVQPAEVNTIPREQLTPESRRTIERLEGRSGIKINVVDRLQNDQMNGEYKDGAITITADALNDPATMRKVAFHEMVHPMRGTESHNELIDYAVDYYRAKYGYKDRNAVMAAVSYGYTNSDTERAGRYDVSNMEGRANVEDELAAMFVGDLVKDKAIAEKMSRDNPPLARRIVEMLQKFVDKIKGFGMSENEREIARATEQAIKSFRTGLATVKDNGGYKPPKALVSEGDSISGGMYNVKTLDMGEMANIERDLKKKYEKSPEEVDTVLNHMKTLRDYMEQLGNELDANGDRMFEYLYNWNNREALRYSNGKPVMTWIKKNGEYDMNVEASLVCIKKEPMNRVLQYMLDEGIFDISNLRSTDYATLTRILNEHGLRVPCGACFVENRRENTGPDMFRKIASEFNELVDAANIVDGKVDEASLNAKMKEMAARKAAGEDGTAEGTTKRYAKFIKENPDRVRKIAASEFMTPEGALVLKRDMPAIYSIATSRYGAGTAKPVEPKTPYTGEVRAKKPTKAGKWSLKGALKVGGVRNQSFSDDEASLFLDQCQKYLDFSLNQLPAQEYTKVPYHARMFGLTGAKMNLSMFPEAQISAEDRAYLNTLTREQKEKDPVFLRAQENAGLDANGNFLWNPESFGWDNAVELCEDPRYSGNVAPNAVGVSDKQIWMLFDNKYVGQVIPFHKSGQNNDVAAMRNTDLFKDYSNYQNDMEMDENSQRMEGESDASYYRRLGEMSGYGKKIGKGNKLKFNFYDDLAKTNDPVQTSKNFIEACDKQNIIPRFPQFIYKPDGTFNENYWKCITDYPLMDVNGNYKPMQPIQFDEQHLPENWQDVLRTALEEEQKLYNDIASETDAVAREAAAEIRSKFNTPDGMSIGNDTGFKLIDRNNGSYSVNDTDFMSDADRFNAMADEYGTIPRGENPFGNNRDIDVPASTDGQDRTRQFIRTGMEAEQVADETVSVMQGRMTSDVYDGKMSYTPISNAETVQMANDELNTALKNNLDAGMSPDQARQKVLDDGYSEFHGKVIGNELPSATEVAKAERLIQIAQDAGDYQRAADIIIDMSVVGTQLGQAMQAYSMLKRLSPQGQLMALQRSIDRMNKMHTQKGAEKIALPEGFAQEYLQARSNAKREELADQAFKEAAQQLEGTWADKINAYRYSCMLCNPATHARNLLSNGVMGLAGKVGDGASGLMQDAIIGKGEKTRSFKKGRKYTPEERAELHQLVEDMWNDSGKKVLGEGGSKYDNATSAIEQNKRIFKNDILENTIGNGKFSVSSALEAEDMIFKQIHYKDTLMGYIQANGFTPQEIKQAIADGRNIEKPNGASLYRGVAYAENMARKRTFTEDNKVSNWLNEGAKLKAGNLPVGEVLLGGIIPYRRTPLNIMVRGIEYSPAGLAMTLHKAMHVDSNATFDASNKNGTYTVAEVLDSLGANLSGTAIFILGVYMQANGLLNGSGDDDKKKQNFDRATGRQEFSVNTPGGGTATIDWLSPAAMPLLAGAATFESLTAEEKNMDAGTLSRVLENLARISDPAFEMSCMQGVTEALSSYNSGVSGATSALWSGLSSYGGQFVPNVVKKVAYAIDDTKRSTYSPKNSPLTKSGAKFEKGIRGGLPLVSKTLQPKIDMWGNDEQRDIENKGWRLISGLVNPTNYKSNRKGKVENELERLYNEVGESKVFPSSTQGYVQYRNENLYMNEDEYTKYARTKGKNSYKYIAEFMQTPEYNEMPDTEKVTVIEKLYNVANYQARKEFVTGYDGAEFVPDTQYENPLTYKDGVVKYCMAKTGAFAGSDYSVDKIDEIKALASEAGLSNETYMDIRSNITGKDDEGNNLSKDYKKAYLTEQRNNGTLTGKQYWTIYLNNVTPSAADITQCGNELGRDSELFQRYKKEYNASHKKQVR